MIFKRNKEDFALFFGVLLGDGCLSLYKTKKGSNYYAISISGNFYDDKKFYSNTLIPLVNKLRNNKLSIKVKERPKYGKLEILFCDKELFYTINHIGFPIGKKGISLKIPKFFYEQNLLKFIIQGLFSTDGSLVLTKNPTKLYPRIEIHGISRKLIKQVHNYLCLIGLKGHFYKCKRKYIYTKWVKKDQYRIQFNGKSNLLLFKELIGFVNPKHNVKFFNFIKYDNSYKKNKNGCTEN